MCQSSTFPPHSRKQRSLRLTIMIGRRPVTYYYSPKCPAAGCSEAAWKRLNKCRGKSKEESVEKLKHHLHASKLHYMTKPDAEALAESYDGWQQHDTDEEDVPPGLDAPPVNSGAPLAACRHRSLTPARAAPKTSVFTLRRSRPKTPSPRREGRRRRHGIPIALADMAVADSVATSFIDNDQPSILSATTVRRMFVSVQSSILAARHAERLSLSAADAFNREASTLECSLDALEEALSRSATRAS